MRWNPRRSSRRREAVFSAPVTAVSRRIPGMAASRADQGGHGGGTDALPSRRRGESVADLDAALAVGRPMGPEIAEDLTISAADHEPHGRQDSGRAGVDVADGRAHGSRDSVVPGSFLKRAGDRSAIQHGLCDAARDRLQRQTSGVDRPAALPVSGIWTWWLCHVRLPARASLPPHATGRGRTGDRRLKVGADDVLGTIPAEAPDEPPDGSRSQRRPGPMGWSPGHPSLRTQRPSRHPEPSGRLCNVRAHRMHDRTFTSN